MIPMKKFLALALALVMSLSLVACGGNTATDTTQNDDTTDDQTTQEVTADDIEDNMTSEDGAYEVAFVTPMLASSRTSPSTRAPGTA